jgi:hypothetical protein
VTASTKYIAAAASAALPPFSSMMWPMRAACGSSATAPPAKLAGAVAVAVPREHAESASAAIAAMTATVTGAAD